MLSKSLYNLQKINELIEEIQWKLSLGFVNYEKAFESAEHSAIFNSLWEENSDKNAFLIIFMTVLQ